MNLSTLPFFSLSGAKISCREKENKVPTRVQLTISTSAEKPLPPPSSLKSEPSADATKVFSESYCSRTLEVSCRTAWRERKVRQMVAAMGLRTARSTPRPQQSHSPFSTWGSRGRVPREHRRAAAQARTAQGRVELCCLGIVLNRPHRPSRWRSSSRRNGRTAKATTAAALNGSTLCRKGRPQRSGPHAPSAGGLRSKDEITQPGPIRLEGALAHFFPLWLGALW